MPPPDEAAGSAALPAIDEHSVEIAAGRKRVWDALVAGLPGGSPAERSRQVGAALLGWEERRATGRPGEVGSTLVGFRVERARPRKELALTGRHRLSRYALTFRIEDGRRAGTTVLRAATDAEFPGVAGRAYRALVIGSGIHARVMRGMLAGFKRRAEAEPGA